VLGFIFGLVGAFIHIACDAIGDKPAAHDGAWIVLCLGLGCALGAVAPSFLVVVKHAAESFIKVADLQSKSVVVVVSVFAGIAPATFAGKLEETAKHLVTAYAGQEAERLLAQGNKCYQDSKYSSAVLKYSMAILLQPQMTEAYVQRGAAHEASGNKAAAERDYSTAIQSSPSNPVGYLKRSELYLKSGQYSSAKLDLKTVFRLDPNSSKAKELCQDLENTKEASTEDPHAHI
jgi:tetratricopeptide (TPR) repeat protein